MRVEAPTAGEMIERIKPRHDRKIYCFEFHRTNWSFGQLFYCFTRKNCAELVVGSR